MSWSRCLALVLCTLSGAAFAEDLLPPAVGAVRQVSRNEVKPVESLRWKEFGFVQSEAAVYGKLAVTVYRFKDTTGALAGWEWLRPADGRSCQLAAFCTEDSSQAIVFDGNNYVAVFKQPVTKPQVEVILQALPDAHETSLPALLTFVPRQALVPNSARYILGPASLHEAAPELESVNPGFEQGAEGHLSQYKLGSNAVRLALFYYPTPEMARLHLVDFKLVTGVRAKRSGVLVAAVLDAKSDAQADTLLSRVRYEAKITWNEAPPPSPIKPMYQLLSNILYLSGILSALCLCAGLVYAGMRIYRRRYGQLDSEEAMTTLHLRGD